MIRVLFLGNLFLLSLLDLIIIWFVHTLDKGLGFSKIAKIYRLKWNPSQEELSNFQKKLSKNFQTFKSRSTNPDMSTIQNICCLSCLDCASSHLEIFRGVQHRLQTKISQKYALVTPQNLPYYQHMNLLEEIAGLEKQFGDNEAASPEINSLCSRHLPLWSVHPRGAPNNGNLPVWDHWLILFIVSCFNFVSAHLISPDSVILYFIHALVKNLKNLNLTLWIQTLRAHC
jgi:hypothetical protein